MSSSTGSNKKKAQIQDIGEVCKDMNNQLGYFDLHKAKLLEDVNFLKSIPGQISKIETYISQRKSRINHFNNRWIEINDTFEKICVDINENIKLVKKRINGIEEKINNLSKI